MSGESILLADDDRNLRRILTYKLEKEGFRVTAVGDGREAVELFRRGDFPVVVTDLEMPGMNGMVSPPPPIYMGGDAIPVRRRKEIK